MDFGPKSSGVLRTAGATQMASPITAPLGKTEFMVRQGETRFGVKFGATSASKFNGMMTMFQTLVTRPLQFESRFTTLINQAVSDVGYGKDPKDTAKALKGFCKFLGTLTSQPLGIKMAIVNGLSSLAGSHYPALKDFGLIREEVGVSLSGPSDKREVLSILHHDLCDWNILQETAIAYRDVSREFAGLPTPPSSTSLESKKATDEFHRWGHLRDPKTPLREKLEAFRTTKEWASSALLLGSEFRMLPIHLQDLNQSIESQYVAARERAAKLMVEVEKEPKTMGVVSGSDLKASAAVTTKAECIRRMVANVVVANVLPDVSIHDIASIFPTQKEVESFLGLVERFQSSNPGVHIYGSAGGDSSGE